jgi:NAD(P)-dependent dehydrogenase (short-subunit alcohol dehydrogenase family)
MLLNDKNILITGASSGIGKVIAYKCSELGAYVRLVARNKDALGQIVKDLGSQRASYHILDMRNPEAYETVISQIVSEYGRLNGFVHAAGIQITLPIQNMSISQCQDLFLVNTFSAFDISRVLSLKKNRDPGGLNIVFIASIMSEVANPALVAYCSSKAALVGGARSMALELAPKGIRVNCISPGYIEDTPMMTNLIDSISENELDNLKQGYPLGLGRSTDVASLCAFLLSDKSRWITGQNLIVDGGFVLR